MICHDLYQYLASKHGTRSNTSNKQHKRHDRQMKRLRSLKNDVRKQFRYAKSHNFPPEQILSLSKQYHQLVRQHSKVRHQSLSNAKSSNANRQQRACNFWSFSKDLLDDNTFATISPAFSEQSATSYFTSTYSGTDHEYTTPAWLPQPAPPSYPFDDCPISTEEIFFNIHKSRSSSSPSPLDQLPYAIFKRCPSLTPALHYLFNQCWTTRSVPAAWNVGVVRLIGKKSASEDAKNPANFRPIALTPCLSKLYTNIIKHRWHDFMVTNNYLNLDVQKAFANNVPGCIEHQQKLLSVMADAKASHRSLSLCWLDLANAYGSVPHNLIHFSLRHYHAPPHLSSIITNLYSNLSAMISSKHWNTSFIPFKVGVFQGDPLSVSIFNTVINTLIDVITNQPQLGYNFSSINHSLSLFSNMLMTAVWLLMVQQTANNSLTWLTAGYTGLVLNPKCLNAVHWL